MTTVIVLDAAQTPVEPPNAKHTVAIGGRLMDLRLGHGWWDTVDLDRLDQAWPDRCVLGQTHGGDWMAGLANLFPDLSLPERYRAAERAGFWVNDHQPDGEPVQSDMALTRYEQLTQAWQAAIVARRQTWR